MNASPRAGRAGTGYACALLATMIWSGNFIVSRGLAQDIGPVTLALYRWTTATAILLPFAWPALKRQYREIRANLGYLAVVSFLGVTVFNTVIYKAGHATTAMNMALIAVFSPVWIVILARVFLAEPLTMGRLTGLALAATGVVVLTTKGDLAGLAALECNPGDAWMLAATMIFAVYTVLVRRKPESLEPTAFLAATFILGLVMIMPWAAWEWMSIPPAAPTGRVLGAVVYVGLGASLLSYLFWNKAVAAIGPANAGAVYYSLPLFSGLEAWLILGEEITWVHAASGVMIISGIVLATRARARRVAKS